MTEIILEARNVSKLFAAQGRGAGDGMLKALNDVSLKVTKGRSLGLVGESGCGKSTFVKCLLNLFPPTQGAFFYRGRNLSELKGEELRQSRRHIQIVFQDPATSFNPRMTVEEIVCEPLLNFKLISKKQTRSRAEELLAMVELPSDYVSRRPLHMSGGQRQRVGLARALALSPEILVCDESTSALDVLVQKRIIELLVRLQRELGLTIIFICHDLALVQSFCHQVAIMYLGSVVEVLGDGQMKRARHPYTRALLDSIFPLCPGAKMVIKNLEGEVPSPIDSPPGCPFQGRCETAEKVCLDEKPRLAELEPGHLVACHAM
ncbi:MAG: ABC transporter ATP-binding protein [Deltaproteobacteria bacterium]|jgi:peptide/nickel transport system ATP-binding protein|nr:ABC transporter ATP-binding protein [Deltaproteobacteria bacterium]